MNSTLPLAASLGRTRDASRLARYAPVALLLLAAPAGVACSGSASSTLASPDASVLDASAPVSNGTADRPNNGLVEVDKLKITGSFEGGMLRLTVPVRAVDPHGASGTLRVRLLDVQGVTTASEVSLPYALGPGAAASLQTSLLALAPAGLAGEADLVRWNVRIDDDKPASLRVTRSLLLVIPPHDVRLEGPSSVTSGRGS
jgi:hypothetical protein